MSSARKYFTFDFPASVPGGKTLLTGIRGVTDSNKVYISGFYEPPESQTIPFIYKGCLCGKKGNWYTLNFPSSPEMTVIATNLYGVNNGIGSNVQVVGNYMTEETSSATLGCLYEGPIDGTGEWTTLLPTSSEPVLNTIAHSTMGDLVVGNYDTQVDEGRAFIYDIKNKQYYDITTPDMKSITAYGIWFNGEDSYTICGGYTDLDDDDETGFESGYIVDWNRKNAKLSRFKTYSYGNDPNNTLITHFNGITFDGEGGYYLTGDWEAPPDLEKSGPATEGNAGPATEGNAGGHRASCGELCDRPAPKGPGFFAHVKGKNRHATWSSIAYPGQEATSGNSVYQTTVIGIYMTESGDINGYVSKLKSSDQTHT